MILKPAFRRLLAAAALPLAARAEAAPLTTARRLSGVNAPAVVTLSPSLEYTAPVLTLPDGAAHVEHVFAAFPSPAAPEAAPPSAAALPAEARAAPAAAAPGALPRAAAAADSVDADGEALETAPREDARPLSRASRKAVALAKKAARGLRGDPISALEPALELSISPAPALPDASALPHYGVIDPGSQRKFLLTPEGDVEAYRPLHGPEGIRYDYADPERLWALVSARERLVGAFYAPITLSPALATMDSAGFLGLRYIYHDPALDSPIGFTRLKGRFSEDPLVHAALDHATGSLLTVSRSGRVAGWADFADSGKPAFVVDLARRVVDAAFDEGRRILFLLRPRGRLEALRLDERGRPAGEPVRARLPFPARALRHDSVTGRLFAFGKGAAAAVDARAIESPGSGPDPKALASRWKKAGADVARRVGLGLQGRAETGLLRDAWAALAKGVLADAKAPSTSLRAAGGARWDPVVRERIRRRMPTLAAILADPGKTERFLSALSLLRLAVPESLPSDYAGSVREWARDAGLEFRLNELVILPASESFRRHVILVEDAEGTWGLELKMPGEDESRTWLSPAHWTLNRIFQKEFPKDHGLARAAYFGSFAGRMRLYGQLRDYGSWRENLNLALIEWSDGRRLRRGGAWLARLSREQNRPVEAIIDEARVQAAVFAARLHGRGWVGESAAGQDMHDENLRVAGDGRAELVSDFGAFHRGRMSAAARRESALRLMGYPSRAELKRIRRRVFALLKKDARPAELREARLIFDKPD